MDLLSFALDLVAAEMGIDRAVLAPIEFRVRRDQGGDRHYIASNAAIECQARHEAVREARAAGVSATAIAERMGISRQHVYRIIGGAAGEVIQTAASPVTPPDLFPRHPRSKTPA